MFIENSDLHVAGKANKCMKNKRDITGIKKVNSIFNIFFLPHIIWYIKKSIKSTIFFPLKSEKFSTVRVISKNHCAPINADPVLSKLYFNTSAAFVRIWILLAVRSIWILAGRADKLELVYTLLWGHVSLYCKCIVKLFLRAWLDKKTGFLYSYFILF